MSDTDHHTGSESASASIPSSDLPKLVLPSPAAHIPPEEANDLLPLEAAHASPWLMGAKDSHPPKDCAVAYYQHFAQNKHKNSIQIQAEQVRAYAKEKVLKFSDPWTGFMVSDPWTKAPMRA